MDQTDKNKPKVEKSETEWRAQLTPEQYHVTREHGTERPFTSPLLQEKRGGTFNCVACGAPAVSFRHQVRIRHRLAELLRAGFKGCREGNPRRFLWHATHRNPLRELRCASRACVSGWTAADRTALLHEWLRA
jgi:hypothetical protein